MTSAGPQPMPASPNAPPPRAIVPPPPGAAPKGTTRPETPPPTAASRPTRPAAPPPEANPPAGTHRPIHWAILVGVGVLALALRIREAMSTAVLPTEEPYLHMMRTWDLMQGRSVQGTPPGFMVFLAPFALMGADAFYFVARYFPAILGVGGVVGVFFLLRSSAHPLGALTGALAVAVMPEHILRTSVLSPTALTLAVLPVVFLAALKLNQGLRWPMPALVSLLILLLFTHPLVVALVLPVLAVFWLVNLVLRRDTRRWHATAGGATAASFSLVLLLTPGAAFASRLGDHAMPRLGELLFAPTTFLPLPPHVNLMWQVGWPIIVLGIAGAVLAVIRRNRVGILALIWTAFMLPLALVDWFGDPMMPYRMVVLVGLGFAVLAALPIGEFVRLLQHVPQPRRSNATWGAVAIVALILLPLAAATPTWYRLYEEEDHDAYNAVGAMSPAYVVAGSWQAQAGYRALTGGQADYMREFFQDQRVRELTVEARPGIVVLVDDHTIEEGLPTAFLEDWTLLGQWGTTRAYAPQ